MDWLTHKPETMDVQHEDGLFIIDPAGNERVEDVGMPDVQGHLSKVLRSLLNENGQHNLAHPQLAWTARDAMDDIDHLLGRTIPASQAPKTTAPTPAAAAAALRGAPSQLAALHQQASKILPGGVDALTARVRALKGTPVVINAWASWCPPCRAEFSEFGAISARYGRQVAFIGADVNDSPSSGQQFLNGHPVSYPSYSDPQTNNLGALAPLPGTPTTVFVNASGKVAFIHPGEYDTAATLEHDVQHYALGKGAS
jgi:thiol-disulfide isomerase/thioredoxin